MPGTTVIPIINNGDMLKDVRLIKLNPVIEAVNALSADLIRDETDIASMKAIIAFSLDLENANDNLRRHGYAKQWRNRALKNYASYVNTPSMAGIPFTELATPWWVDMPY